MNRITDTKQSSYKVVGRIGEGAFGDIFKVKSMQNQKGYLALKHIRYKGSYNEQISIENEISCLSALRHEHIIEFVDILIKEYEVNIIMEYADGGNLQDLILMETKLSRMLVFDIFIQILQAVEFCHENDIAHRDLTPSNVLLTRNKIVKLADFGISMRCIDSEGNFLLCNDFLGNKVYLAPEVIRKQIHNAILADVWSLGVLLFFMVFNDSPFNGFDDEILGQQESILDILHTDSDDDVDDLLTATIVGFMKIDPCQRVKVQNAVSCWKNNEYSSV